MYHHAQFDLVLAKEASVSCRLHNQAAILIPVPSVAHPKALPLGSLLKCYPESRCTVATALGDTQDAEAG